ncbi:MAG: hypothetical protein LR001_08095 [Clostridiales bacterium]|nr:hypothetical protein [Clostridiales bacterium]
MVKKAASPRNLSCDKSEHIIFPYYYDNGKLIRYSQERFEKQFPMATKHLIGYADSLRKRTSDSNVLWFEYGRTQALAHLEQTKLLLSTVVTNKVKVYERRKQYHTQGFILQQRRNFH